MSATWPRRCRCCGRRREGEPRARRRDRPHLRRGRAAARREPDGRAAECWRDMLDHLDASGRFALLKLATGALRVGISRAPRQAGAGRCLRARCRGGRGGVARAAAALSPSCSTGPRAAAPQPTARDVPVFRPFMLAHPLDETQVSLDDYAAEWKWDGIRVQLVHAGGETRLYSRTGDDISRQLPGRRRGLRDAGGARRRTAGARRRTRAPTTHGGAAASFNALQQRLGRKNVSAEDAGRLSGLRPALRHIVRRRRGSARAALDRAARAARAFVGAARSRALRPVAADRGARASKRWRSFAPARATRRSRA